MTTGGGKVSSSLTSLRPYARYEISERTSVWRVLGYGVGNLSLTPARSGSALETDLSHSMVAIGGRTALSVRSGEAGRFESSVRNPICLEPADRTSESPLDFRDKTLCLYTIIIYLGLIDLTRGP